MSKTGITVLLFICLSFVRASFSRCQAPEYTFDDYCVLYLNAYILSQQSINQIVNAGYLGIEYARDTVFYTSPRSTEDISNFKIGIYVNSTIEDYYEFNREPMENVENRFRDYNVLLQYFHQIRIERSNGKHEIHFFDKVNSIDSKNYTILYIDKQSFLQALVVNKDILARSSTNDPKEEDTNINVNTTNNETEASNNETETSHNETEASHNETETSHNETEASHNETVTSHNETEASHDETEDNRKTTGTDKKKNLLVYILSGVAVFVVLMISTVIFIVLFKKQSIKRRMKTQEQNEYQFENETLP